MVVRTRTDRYITGEILHGSVTYNSWSAIHDRKQSISTYKLQVYNNQDLTPVTPVKSTIHILLSNLNRSSSGCRPRSPSNCLHLRSLAQRHTRCRLGKPACHLHSNTNVSGGHLPIGYQTSRLSMSQSWHDDRERYRLTWYSISRSRTGHDPSGVQLSISHEYYW